MRNYYKPTFLAAFVLWAASLNAQNSVAIGSPTPDNAAVLLLVGNGSQGLILPITANIGGMPKKQGMVVYNSSDSKIYVCDGTNWTSVGAGAGGSQTLSISGNTISISGGNSITLATAPTAGQFYMFDGTNWVAKSLSQDVANNLGVITVNGIKGKPLPSSFSAGFLQSDASGNLSWAPGTGGSTYSAGTGLTLTGSTFSVNNSQNISTLSNLSSNGLIKTSGGTGALSIATSGIDYAPATSGSSLLFGNGSGGFNNVTIGSNLTFSAGTLSAIGPPILSATQVLTGNGTTNTATILSGDASINAGALKVTGIQNKSITLPGSGTQYLSYDATTGQWVFQTPTGSGDMLKATYDPTGKNADAFDLTKHSGVLPLANGGTGITSALSATQILIGNGTTNSAATLTGDASINAGALKVTGIQNKAITLPGSGTQYLSYDATAGQWVFQTPTGTSYLAGTGLTLTGNTFSVNNSQNISSLSNLSSNGLVKTSGGTGALSIATAGTDYLVTESDPTVKAISGLVKSNGTTIGAVVSGTDIKTINSTSILGSGNITLVSAEADPIVKAINGVVKSNGTTISAAVAGTDYAPATSGSSILYGNGTGGFSNVVIGSNLTFSAGTLSATGGFTNPMTTSGDIIYESGTLTPTRLAGNTTTTKMFLTQTGTGAVSAAPAWASIAASDIPTLNQNTTGSAGSVANALTIGAELISGGPSTYNGSLAKTIGIQSSSVTNAMLAGSITSSKLVGTDIATVGTITSGTWNGTKISEAYGGTNQSSYAAGDLLYASTPSTLAKLAIGSPNQVLTVNAGGTAPYWASMGTPLTTANAIPKGNGTSQVASIMTDNGNTVTITSGAATDVLNVKNTGNTAYSQVTIDGLIGSYLSMRYNGTQTAYMYSVSGGTFLGTQSADPFSLTTAGTTRMTLDATGNVGIGTASPVSKLDVSGDLHLSQITAPGSTADKLYNVGGSLFWNGTNISSGGSGFSTSNVIPKGNGTGLASSLLYDNGTGIGLNTSSPATDFQIDNTQPTLRLRSKTASTLSQSWVEFGHDDGLGGFTKVGAIGDTGSGDNLYLTSPNNILFNSNLADRFAIGTSGQLGVGSPLDFGTAGYVLTSGGATGSAKWSSLPSSFNTINTIPKGDGTTMVASQIYDNGTNVGIGTTSPSYATEISNPSYQLLRLVTSNSNSYADMSIAATGGGDARIRSEVNGLTFQTGGINDRLRIDATGKVGIGTSVPASQLDVQANLNAPAKAISGVNNGGGHGVYGYSATGGTGVWGYSPAGTGVYGQSDNGYGVFANSTNSYGLYAISSGTNAIYGVASSDASAGVMGYNSLTTGTLQQGVFGEADGANGHGVDGYSNAGVGVYGSSGSGTAGYFNGKVTITGLTTLTGAGLEFTAANPYIQFPASSTSPMIYMFKSGTTNANKMVLAHSTTYSNYGLQYDDTNDKFNFLSAGSTVMSVNLATSTGAVTMAGNLSVAGTLSKGAGTFKIDHPADPENKFLYHSFVESPDMMNVYNGNIITEGNGEAVVTLPDYFEALNKDFRYQLTVIGDFAQAIVYKKIANNKFVIKTDKPNIEVSWQVTGIRKDPYAEKNRVSPEVMKSPEEKGKYLHPDAYGLPPEKGINSKPNQ